MADMEASSRPTRQISRHVPGEEGIWVFIFGDLLAFSAFFVTYLVYRAQNLSVFLAGQELLSRGLGLLNTLLLLTSSWFVAQAVKDTRNGGARTPMFIGCAMACGLGFCVVKAFEYAAKINAGYTLNSTEFFIYYYMFTGIHLVHVTIGLGVLTYLLVRARTRPADENVSAMEGGGAFWHLVDLLWVVLFALLYLVR
jgi:nitric oxide reductase NorE protein